MYLDLLILFNLIVNYFLLLMTAKLLRRNPGFWRLSAGAAAGALALFVIDLPPYPGLVAAVTLLAPLLMLLLSFWPLGWFELALTWGAFFLLSFTVGGAVLALTSFIEDGRALPGGITALLLVCLLLYLLLGLLRPYLEEKKWQKLLSFTLIISWQGFEQRVPALLDTGNRLRDPLHHRPVIVIDFQSLKGMLPAEVYRCLNNPDLEPWSALQELHDQRLARFFTLVPFDSLGASRQMLLGFRPDAAIIDDGAETWALESGVVLALNRGGFGPVSEYRALLPPELIKAG